MPKPFTPKVITANALLEGDVIYLTDDGWTRQLAQAEVLTDEAHADLRLIEAAAQTGDVVGVYLADVTLEGDTPPDPFSRRFPRPWPFQLCPRQTGAILMYHYTDFDDAFLDERNAQFRAQVERRIDGSLTEDEFKPLRLMNGLYLQLHAYMLRVAIPYGTLNSRQMDSWR